MEALYRSVGPAVGVGASASCVPWTGGDISTLLVTLSGTITLSPSRRGAPAFACELSPSLAEPGRQQLAQQPGATSASGEYWHARPRPPPGQPRRARVGWHQGGARATNHQSPGADCFPGGGD